MEIAQVANGIVHIKINHMVNVILSLTVEVQRAKGPNIIQDRDPIFERGSTTTYSSFRKGNYSKPWSVEGLTLFKHPKWFHRCVGLFAGLIDCF